MVFIYISRFDILVTINSNLIFSNAYLLNFKDLKSSPHSVFPDYRYAIASVVCSIETYYSFRIIIDDRSKVYRCITNC